MLPTSSPEHRMKGELPNDVKANIKFVPKTLVAVSYLSCKYVGHREVADHQGRRVLSVG